MLLKIAEITHGDVNIVLHKKGDKLSTMLYNEINGLRAGTIEDNRHWLVPVEVNVLTN